MNHKHLFRRLLAAVLTVTALMALALPAAAWQNASSWAVPNLEEASRDGLLPDDLKQADMRAEITRREMCYIGTIAYEKLTGNSPTPNRTDYFADTDDDLICAAYEIGIINGSLDEDGERLFRPEDLLTRQEFFQILVNLNRSIGQPVNLTTDYLAGFKDRGLVADWAEAATQEVVGLGVVQGENGYLKPQSNTSRQEAIVMFLRSYKNSCEYLSTEWITQEELDALNEAAAKEAASSEATQLVAYALQFTGTPYVFGGTSPSGFDCSGFTQYVYKHFGYSINRIADDQVNNGVAVEFSALKPGDLICFANTYSSSDWITHVGIYIGNGKMVHAANRQRGVTVDTITSGYYFNHYAAARRILK